MNKILLFALNDLTLGIELKYVQKIIETNDIKPIPLAPYFVSGLLNHRGSFLTIINLALLCGTTPGKVDQEARIIILDDNETDIGILAGKVMGTKELSFQNKKKEPIEITHGEANRFFKITLEQAEGTPEINILDSEKLLRFVSEYTL